MSVYITGCEKDAEVFDNNDLTTHNTQTFELREEVSNYHPYYLEIYKDLLEKDSQTGFSNRFISELGVPLWNKMIVFDSIPHQIFTITPIVDSVTEKITGLLKVSRFNDKDFYEVIEKSSIQNRINNINGNYINLESLKTDIAFFNIFSWNVFYHSDPDYNNLSSAVGQINLLVPRNVIRIMLPYWVWEDCCYEDGDRDCHSPPGGGAPGHWVLKYRVFFVFVPGDSGGYERNNWGGINDGMWVNSGDGDGEWWSHGNDWTNNGGGGSNSNSKNNFNLFFNPLSKIVKNIVLYKSKSFLRKHSINLTPKQLFEIIGVECYNIDTDEDGVVLEVSIDEDCALEKLCDYNVNSFKAKYGIDLKSNENIDVYNSISDCSNQEKFEEEAMENLAEHYSSQTTNDYPTPENTGFFDRTLSCESFIFIAQPDASGQIACVKGLYLSKNYGPAHYNTPDFCGHFTVPRIRYNGEVISASKAANCSAWAANAAAAVAGIAFSKNFNITDEGLKIIFKKSYNIKMKLTSCGYGAMTECENAECLGPEQQAIWNDGFFEWLGEQFFNCD